MNSQEEKAKDKSMYDLKLHEVLGVTKMPYFRVMRVPTGWLYNFYDEFTDNYLNEWVFVPSSTIVTN